METNTLSRPLIERMEILLSEFRPANLAKLLRVVYFDHLYRQHETGLRIGFDKEVQMMNALFEFLEFADEKSRGLEKQDESDYSLN